MASDTSIKAEAVRLRLPTKGLDINQMKRRLIQIGHQNVLFDILPQTSSTWYNHIQRVIATSGIGPLTVAEIQIDGALVTPNPIVSITHGIESIGPNQHFTRSAVMMNNMLSDLKVIKRAMHSTIDLVFLKTIRDRIKYNDRKIRFVQRLHS